MPAHFICSIRQTYFTYCRRHYFWEIAKTIFEALWNKEGGVDEIIEKRGLKQVTDTGAIEN